MRCVWRAAHKVTLPALQKQFVNIFFVFAWEFCIEKRRGFLVNFSWSPFPAKRSTKTPRKLRGKFGAKFGEKFGTKIRMKYGCRKVRVYPTECGQQVGRDSLKNGSSKSLVLKTLFIGGNTLGLVPSNLPHTLGYACTLYAPTSPHPNKGNFWEVRGATSENSSQHPWKLLRSWASPLVLRRHLSGLSVKARLLESFLEGSVS